MGAAGHSTRLAERIGSTGTLVGIDNDAEILEIARSKLAALSAPPHFELVQGNFAEVARRDLAGRQGFDIVLADLGVSSLQLDEAGRGFSFRKDGPLDMRMDTSRGATAREYVESTSVDELERVIRDYGEERHARAVARAIDGARRRGPIETTSALADIVRSVVRRGRRDAFDPATRTFQAIRIAVNRELDVLEQLLARLVGLVRPGGRCAVISFHSLEDRLVKQAFRELDADGEIELLTKKPVRPTDEEVNRNPRSRSSRLRAFRRRV